MAGSDAFGKRKVPYGSTRFAYGQGSGQPLIVTDGCFAKHHFDCCPEVNLHPSLKSFFLWDRFSNSQHYNAAFESYKTEREVINTEMARRLFDHRVNQFSKIRQYAKDRHGILNIGCLTIGKHPAKSLDAECRIPFN